MRNTFSPWFGGTPSYSSYASDPGGSSLLSGRPRGVSEMGGTGGHGRSFEHEAPIEVAMPRVQTMNIPSSGGTQRRPQQQQQQQNSTTNNIKTMAKMAKEFKNQLFGGDITGTGPSVPGYSTGMDLSGEAAIMAADAASAAEATSAAGTALPATEVALTGSEAGLALSGVEAGTGAEAALAAEGILAAEGATGAAGLALGGEAAAGAGTAATGAAAAEGAGTAAAGMSSTGIGAIIAAAAAAIIGIESSTGWNSLQVLDKQIMEGVKNINEGDIGNLAANSVSNPWNYAVEGGEVTAGKFFGFHPSILPANLVNNLFV
jgi:hypothetical protein